MTMSVINKIVVGVVTSLLIVYMGVLSANQIELARRGAWMESVEHRLVQLEEDNRQLIANSYTRREAEKDFEHMKQMFMASSIK